MTYFQSKRFPVGKNAGYLDTVLSEIKLKDEEKLSYLNRYKCIVINPVFQNSFMGFL